MTHIVTRHDVLDLVDDLVEALKFDSEHCDFGPAYGMWEKRRRDALRRAKFLLEKNQFVKRRTRLEDAPW